MMTKPKSCTKGHQIAGLEAWNPKHPETRRVMQHLLTFTSVKGSLVRLRICFRKRRRGFRSNWAKNRQAH